MRAALEALGTRRATVCVLALASLLAATSLGDERALDDWVIALIAGGGGEGRSLGVDRPPWDCFTFADGDVEHNRRLIDSGTLLPWWSDPQLKVTFFRPLASATHRLDELLWPDSALAMHLHSLAWFSLLLISVALVYRRFAGSAPLAGLSFALYALDDAHGGTVGWLANRNALIAGACACFSLVAHDAWRRTRSKRHAVLAVSAFALSWAAGEFAVGALAYLVSYAACIELGSKSQRLLSLLPYALFSAAWRLLWSHAGYGVRGSGAYVDPLGDWEAFLREAPTKWLSLLQGQFGVIPADFSFFGAARHQPLWLATGALTLALCAVLLARHVKDATGRFWLGGLLLSLVPLAATFPSDRLLLFVGIGSMALLARLFHSAALEQQAGAGSASARGTLQSVAIALLAGVHLLVAPLLLPLRAYQLRLWAQVEQGALDPALDAADNRGKTVVILAAPNLLLANYAQPRRALLGKAGPEHLYVLSATDSAVRVSRTGYAELTLTPELGFLHSPLERHYRARNRPLLPRARVELTRLTAEVLSAGADGRPASVRFTLRAPLHEYVFLCWSERRFVPCSLPLERNSFSLPAEDLATLQFRAAQGDASLSSPPPKPGNASEKQP